MITCPYLFVCVFVCYNYNAVSSDISMILFQHLFINTTSQVDFKFGHTRSELTGLNAAICAYWNPYSCKIKI